ncbi:unnamed protein product [Blepharisma stoltei]|uniref:ABC transporter domain-containing protein n=1 Tax=Blepharisma stoltei TaxID=1481888 RepID=A0AAU9IB10_9CILI|nr:unnamed protein product [Blepharisma stoltei]
MTFFGHLRALCFKNWLIWKREWVGSACEIFFPVFIMLFMLLLRYSLPAEHKPAKSHLDDGQIIAPSWSMNESLYFNKNLTKSDDTWPFAWCQVNIQYHFTWGIIGNKTSPGLSKYLTEQIGSYFPYTDYKGPMYFDTTDDMEDYVTDSDYDDKGREKICFAVDLSKQKDDNHKVYLRFNLTDILPDEQTVYGKWYLIFLTSLIPPVNKFQKEVKLEHQHNFIYSGFFSIQNMIYNYYLTNKTENPDAYLQFGFVPMYQQKFVKDNFMIGFAMTLGFFMFITSLVPVSRLINKITIEKETKVKEAMKMMGLNDAPYWLSWYIMYMLIYTVISGLLTLIGWDIFSGSQAIVFLILLLYGTSCIAFSSLISSFFSKAKTGILVGVLAYFASYFTIFAVTDTTPASTKNGLSIFNTIAMTQGFYVLLSLKGNQIDSTISNLDIEYEYYKVETCIIMLFVDTILYSLLAFYFGKIVPSQYGVSLPWYFPFTKSFWLGRTSNDNKLDEKAKEFINDEEEKRREEMRQNKNIEDPDPLLLKQIEANQAMTVRGLRKHFGDKIAVDGLDLDIFRNQIFALLGHNGAGKTTTLSMLTGLLKPTGGNMTVDGLDFRTDMPEIRKRLGVCPQHDVLFKNLTVYEHLYMFCRFKGLTDSQAINSNIDEILKEINLEDKKFVRSENLSGGQKRKLSLSIALIGGSSIVMLDEPTSGMDLTARRRVWDMLRNDKHGRIIILTTHYMEEADILADRIAIMSEGKLHCLGSPLFLKNRFGVGYNLTIVKQISASGKEYSQAITDLVKKYIPKAETLSDVSAECTYQIPLSESVYFSSFFKELDRQMANLKIEAYGISVTTLEEVFLRVARGDNDFSPEKVRTASLEHEDKFIQKEDDTATLGEAEEMVFENKRAKTFNIAKDHDKGMLFMSHFLALTQKRIIYSWRDYKGFILEILLPILCVIFGLALLTQFSILNNQKSWKEDLNKFDKPQKVFYNPQPYLNPSAAGASDIKFIMNRAVDNTNGRIKLTEYQGSLEDFDYNIYKQRTNNPFRLGSYYFYEADPVKHAYSVVIFHNTTALQGAPTFAATIGQAFLQNIYNDDNFKIPIYNYPLPLSHKQQNLARNAGTFYVSMIFAIGVSFIPTGLITFIVKERENNIKHQHLVSGVSIPAYWLSSYAWDLSKFMIPGIISVLMIKAFGLKSLVESDDVYGATWGLFLLYGVAICPFTYACSFVYKSYSIAQFFTFIYHLITGAIFATLTWTLRIISETTRDISDVLEWPFRIFSPTFCFSFGIMNISNREAYQSAYKESNIRGPLDWQIAGADICFLCLHAVVSLIMIFVIEWASTVQWFRKIGSARDPGENEYKQDDDVERVKKEAAETDANSVAVKVAGLRKVYGNFFNKTQVKIAIQEISFVVPFQECFALLGVNGAGKTSTFRILTGEYGPTKGEAYINAYNVITHLSEARYNIGYCPQFDALTDLLTPTEHLILYAKIKGIPKDLIKYFVEKQLKDMNLEKYAKVRAGILVAGTSENSQLQ